MSNDKPILLGTIVDGVWLQGRARTILTDREVDSYKGQALKMMGAMGNLIDEIMAENTLTTSHREALESHLREILIRAAVLADAYDFSWEVYLSKDTANSWLMEAVRE